MNTPKRGLGRGLGALIPNAPYPSRHVARATTSATEAPPVVGQRVATQAGEQAASVTAVSVTPTSALTPAQPTAAQLGAPEVTTAQRTPTDFAGAYFTELPVQALRPNPRQPRTVFDEEAMSELVASISAVGLLQPVVVRSTESMHFELIMGERRWRAAVQAGLEKIPAIVRETADHDLLRDALLENLHRASLNPLEEAAAYQQLLDDFDSTHEELATRVGRSRPHISNTLRLLKLTPAVQRRVAAGVLSAGHARALVGLESGTEQERLAARVVAEGLSVRTLEELVAAGDDDRRTPRQRHPRVVAPGLTEIADRLSERFETRCRVELGKRKGKISIEFASLDDLDRILGVLDAPAASQRQRID